MTLLHLQAGFQDYLLSPAQTAILEQVTGTAKVGAEIRLGIYAEAYRLRLIEALDTDFPVLHALLGDDEFDRMARAYIDAYPSRHFSVRWFGQHVSDFLRTVLPCREHPALSEMAAFEWAMTLAFDAADSPLLAMDDMAAVPPASWPGMHFTPHASLHRLDLRWNVPAVWKAHAAGEDVTAPVENPLPIAATGVAEISGIESDTKRAEDRLRLTGGLAPVSESAAPREPVAWVVWRHELTTYFRSIEVDEAWALDALIAGQTFADLCEGLCEWIDAQHVATHAAGFLKTWIGDGMISKIHTR
jgi:hypothetical protein